VGLDEARVRQSTGNQEKAERWQEELDLDD
jgi:hypothetical protein